MCNNRNCLSCQEEEIRRLESRLEKVLANKPPQDVDCKNCQLGDKILNLSQFVTAKGVTSTNFRN